MKIARGRTYRVKRIKTARWFTPPKVPVPIAELAPDQEYAFFRYFPAKGGMRIITASGANLQKSWRRYVKSKGAKLFIAAFHHRPPAWCNDHNPPKSLWQEVILYPKVKYSFMVQRVLNGKAKIR